MIDYMTVCKKKQTCKICGHALYIEKLCSYRGEGKQWLITIVCKLQKWTRDKYRTTSPKYSCAFIQFDGNIMRDQRNYLVTYFKEKFKYLLELMISNSFTRQLVA